MTCEPKQVLICTNKATLVKRRRFGFCLDPIGCCRDCSHKQVCNFVCPSALSKGHDH